MDGEFLEEPDRTPPGVVKLQRRASDQINVLHTERLTYH